MNELPHPPPAEGEAIRRAFPGAFDQADTDAGAEQARAVAAQLAANGDLGAVRALLTSPPHSTAIPVEHDPAFHENKAAEILAADPIGERSRSALAQAHASLAISLRLRDLADSGYGFGS